MPKISVIIPTYNCANYITEAIDSVLGQTYKDYETIVVDDGSIDRTKNIVQEYTNNNPGKITYIYQENKGAGAARNEGIRKSSGEYISFLDADDEWLPEKLEKQMKIFDESKRYSMVFTDMLQRINGELLKFIKEKFKCKGGYIYDSLLKVNFIQTPTVMVNRKCFDKIGLFDESFLIAEDYDLWLRIAQNCEIYFIDEPLVIRNIHSNNTTNNMTLLLSSVIRLREKLLFQNRSNKGRVRILRNGLAIDCFELGYEYFLLDKLGMARRYFIKSFFFGYRRMLSFLYFIVSFFSIKIVYILRKLKRHTVKRG